MFRAGLVFLLLGVGLMIAGTLDRDPATILAATVHFGAGAGLALTDLLTGR